MGAFVNNPNRYVPLAPSDDRVLPSLIGRLSTADQAGLYYASPLNESETPQETAKRFATELRADTSAATLQTYQYWAESGWKAAHGSFSAVARFGEKAYEEHKELHVALLELERGEAKDKPQAEQHVLHELGDVLWCVTALASNSAASVDQSLKNLLYGYVMGISHVENGQDVKPRWRDATAALATKYELLTVGDVDTAIEAGFEPTTSAAMNIFDPEEDQEDTNAHMFTLLCDIAVMRNASERQYGNDDVIPGKPLYVMPETFNAMANIVGERQARAVLSIAFLANRVLGKKLSDVVAENVRVVSARVQHNLVDKADGIRPDELR